MKPTEKFETFLMEQHAKQYMGTDDNMPDDFNKWLCNLEVDEWLAYGDKFNLAVAEALPKIVEVLKKAQCYIARIEMKKSPVLSDIEKDIEQALKEIGTE